MLKRLRKKEIYCKIIFPGDPALRMVGARDITATKILSFSSSSASLSVSFILSPLIGFINIVKIMAKFLLLETS